MTYFGLYFWYKLLNLFQHLINNNIILGYPPIIKIIFTPPFRLCNLIVQLGPIVEVRAVSE